ncbi:ATP-binding cassette domain-containing protein, partial [Acinetobacter baumannii]
DIVIEVGLAYETGIAGARLSGAQRQKVVLARAILKRPDLIILNEAISGYDNITQAQLLAALREEFKDRGLVWALHNPHLADGFDRVVLIE